MTFLSLRTPLFSGFPFETEDVPIGRTPLFGRIALDGCALWGSYEPAAGIDLVRETLSEVPQG